MCINLLSNLHFTILDHSAIDKWSKKETEDVQSKTKWYGCFY